MVSREVEFLKDLMENSKNIEDSKERLTSLAEKHKVPLSRAESVWSFYRKDEAGLKVCTGLPCHLNSRLLNGDLMEKYPEGEREYVSCLGYCDQSPVVMENGKYYHVRNGEAEELREENNAGAHRQNSISDFISTGGFATLRKSLADLSDKRITELAREWDVHGLGGAGFPTYIKWKALSDSKSDERYLVVNAHEGEPGTFKDRVIMEARPFDLIEASLIVAEALGITRIIIALKNEYVNAEKMLKKALESSISHFSKEPLGVEIPKITISRIPGSYVTGEETALLEAMEGNRSEPRLRPPFPAEAGLYGKPTLIDNVETLVYFRELLKNHYSGESERTPEKAYCLTGDVESPGPYFLKYGSDVTTLLHDNGKTDFNSLKAILPGGLSGGILPASKANIALSFESVKGSGAGLGTGSMIALSNERCIVDVMENVENFFSTESCGKCFPCRLGTKEIRDLFSRLKDGDCTLDDIESAEKTASVMLAGSICGLGQAAARMFIDSAKYFRNEMEEHTKGVCPTNVCFAGGR